MKDSIHISLHVVPVLKVASVCVCKQQTWCTNAPNPNPNPKTHMSEVTVETGDHWMLTKHGDTTGKSESDGTQQIVLEGLEERGGRSWARLCTTEAACCRKGNVSLLATTVQLDHAHTEPLPCIAHFTHLQWGSIEMNDGIDVNCVRGSRASQSKHWAHHYTSNDNNNTGKPPLRIVLYELMCLENTEWLHSVGVPSKLHSYTSKTLQVRMWCTLLTSSDTGSTPSPSEAARTPSCTWGVATPAPPSHQHQPHPLWGPLEPAGPCRWWGPHTGTGW